MSTERKRFVTKVASVVFAVLSFMSVILAVPLLSPSNPRNMSARTVAENGAEYTVKLNGIYKYDEKGFTPSIVGFYFTDEKAYIYKDEEGYACITLDGKGENYVLGGYDSSYISYDEFQLCSESYKTVQELEAFFESPDPIYNFDINKLSYYISDVITYKKKFSGKATIKVYRGRCVITEVYIGDEKVLERKK